MEATENPQPGTVGPSRRDDCPFVVTIASEKGGVGKTTIATNLAVYLKALREDLPVTIASFDNHFSIDGMFTIGRHKPRGTVAGLFAGVPVGQLITIGEYGVQYLASDRRLQPPDDDSLHLRKALSRCGPPGLLIFDTRPILDYFTRNALLAADLVLIPVKDRPSLVNAAALVQALRQEGGDPSRIWMLPSLVDARLRLRGNIGIREFLVASAQERGYQVLETFLAKSPKVEGLTTNLSSRVYPVLTHASTTVVHGQFQELAGFVLQRYDACAVPVCAGDAATVPVLGRIPPGRLRRLAPSCPVCDRRTAGEEGHFFQEWRSRRYGFIHARCFQEMLQEAGFPRFEEARGLLLLGGEEWGGDPQGAILQLFSAGGDPVGSERVDGSGGDSLRRCLAAASGGSPEELSRAAMLITLADIPPCRFLGGDDRRQFAGARKKVLREMLGR